MSLRVVCSWCGADMGSVPCVPAMNGQTSHGLCAACAPKLRADLGLEVEPAPGSEFVHWRTGTRAPVACAFESDATTWSTDLGAVTCPPCLEAIEAERARMRARAEERKDARGTPSEDEVFQGFTDEGGRSGPSLCSNCGEVWRGNVHRCPDKRCVRCGRPAASEVCAFCTADMSQSAKEACLRLIGEALQKGGK